MSRKTIVYYGPNQTKLRKTLKMINGFESEKVAKAYKNFCDKVNEEISTKYGKVTRLVSENCILVMKTVEVLLKDESQLKSLDNAMWQACLWMLLSIHYSLKSENLASTEEKKDEYFAGCSFGEFWAVTYSMCREKKLYFYEALYLAYKRGALMEVAYESEETYARVVIGPGRLQNEILEKRVNELTETSDFGKLVLRNGAICLFSTKGLLKDFTDEFGLRLVRSIPFHSNYLKVASKLYKDCLEMEKCRIKKLQLSESVLSDKDTKSVLEILQQQFYMPLDEGLLHNVIEEKIAATGVKEYTIVYL